MSAPERMCIACRKKADKSTFTRVVIENNALKFDLKHDMSGRGAYLCSDDKCLQRAIDKKLFSRALRAKLTPEDYKIFLADIQK